MRERDIFIEAVSKSAGERADYLAAACEGDLELRRCVEQLLAEHENQKTFFLDAPAPGVRADAPALEPLGTMVGPYKLLQVIGEGGMGIVYMAEQREPVQRYVALKVIKPGMDTRQVIARFEAERQALAVMDSPHIAKVLDAGATAAGRPYFVMELVKGLPITRYCDEAHLSVRERLELFLPICQAIQHAHQKGIIHRDIKPSNVMVALYDGLPVPKVIDFGVAKATLAKLTERTLFTEYGQIVGTVEYMSPEQANLNQHDIDTRSDIYSLGVLLYELLTGSTPFNQARLRAAAFDEMLRIIREEEPQKPSTKLTAGDTLPMVAANRNVEPARLSKLMRGDLDWIVMKALEKDRSRRYETASALALDMQRYLDDEAVQACPPSASYRFRKFARRNKRLLATAALLGVMLTGGVSLLVYNNVRIAKEQTQTKSEFDRAERALGAAKDNLTLADANLGLALQALDEVYMKEIEKRVQSKRELSDADRQFLEEGLRFYEQFGQRNSTHAGLQNSTAKSNRRAGYLRLELAQWPEAAAHFRKAISILEKLVAAAPQIGEQRKELASSTHGLSVALRNNGALQEAEIACRRAIGQWEKLTVDFPTDPDCRVRQGQSLWLLREILSDGSKHSPAEQAGRNALALFAGLHTEFPDNLYYQQELAQSNRLLSDSVGAQHRHEETITLRQEAVKLFGDLARRDHSNLFFRQEWANASAGLGYALNSAGQTAEAEAAFLLTIQVFEELIQEATPPKLFDYRQRLAWSLNDYSNHCLIHNRYTAAEDYAKRSLAIHRELIEADPKEPRHRLEAASEAFARTRILQAAGRTEEVAASYAETAQAYQEAFAKYRELAESLPTLNNRWRAAECLGWRGEVLRLHERQEEAVAAWRDSVPFLAGLARETNSPAHCSTLAVRHEQLGALLQAMGRLPEAERSYREAVAVWTKAAQDHQLPEHRTSLAASRLSLATVLAQRGSFKEADELIQGFDTIEARNSFAWRIVSDPKSRVETVQAALAALGDMPRTEKTRHIVNTLGVAYYRNGQWQLAIDTLRTADELYHGGNLSGNGFFLAMAHWQIGEREVARQWYLASLLWMNTHAPDNEEFRQFQAEAAALLGEQAELPDSLASVKANSVEFFDLILGLNREAAWAYDGRGRAHDRDRRYDQAVADFTAAQELEPEYWLYWADRGSVRNDMRQFKEALADLNQALKLHDESYWVWNARAQVHANEDRWQQAIADFTRALELKPDHVDSLNRRGVAYEYLEQYEHACSDYSQAMKLQPDVALYVRNRASANSKWKRHEAAIADYSTAIELDSNDPALWNSRGVVHSRLGHTEQAFCDYSKAIDLHAARPLYWKNRAMVAAKLERYELAIADCSRLIELEPYDASYWNARGDNYYRHGQGELALDDFSRAVELAPENILYRLNRGLVAAELGKHELTVADYTLVVEAYPAVHSYWSRRGNAYSRLKRFDQAYCDYSKAIDLNPQESGYWHSRAWVSAQLGRHAAAVGDYDQAIACDGSFAYYWNNRGAAHAELDQWPAAAADFAQALRLSPQPPLVRYHLALVHLQLGDTTSYRQLCQESLATETKPGDDPMHTVTWTCLLAADAVSDWQPLLDRAAQAAAVQPPEYLALNHHGAALYRAGKHEAALAQLAAAEAAYQPADRLKYTIAYNLLFQALAHHRLGHAAQAEACLAQAEARFDEDVAAAAMEATPRQLGWNRRLTYRLLRLEAQELLKSSIPSKGAAPIGSE